MFTRFEYLESNREKSTAHGTPPPRVEFSHRKAAATIQTSNEIKMGRRNSGARQRRDRCIDVILVNLPHQLCGLWLTVSEILKFLHIGGAKSISYAELTYLLRRSVKTRSVFYQKRFYNTQYYSYGPSLNAPGTSHTRSQNIRSDYFFYCASRDVRASLTKIESNSNFPRFEPDESNSPNYESDVSTPTDNQSFSPEPDRNTSPSVQRPGTEELTAVTSLLMINSVDSTVATANSTNEINSLPTDLNAMTADSTNEINRNQTNLTETPTTSTNELNSTNEINSNPTDLIETTATSTNEINSIPINLTETPAPPL